MVLEECRLFVRQRRREALRSVVTGIVDGARDGAQRGPLGSQRCEQIHQLRVGVAGSSHAASAPGGRITGMRSCSGATAALAATVRIAHERSVPPSGACQIDHSPANANVGWSAQEM